MKRIVIALICILFSTLAIAQEHLEFRGIPLDGSSTSFIAKLTEDGFKYEGRENDCDKLIGIFAGKDCTLYLESTATTKTVHAACVIINKQTEWENVKADYALLKQGLTAKYGEPYESKEEFRGGFKEGDGYEYAAFYGDKADWYSNFQTELGDISLSIKYQEYFSMAVVVTYRDKANSGKVIKELTEVL